MSAPLALLWLAAGAHAAWFGGATHLLDAPKKSFEAGRFEQVVTELTPVLDRITGAEQRQAYLYLGMSHEHLGNLDKALGVYQLGVKLYPRDINLLTELGMLLHHGKLEQQAEPLFQKVLSIHPNNAVAHQGLAEIDHALGFLDRSAEHFEKALEFMTSNAVVWAEYAEVLIAARDYKTAELAARTSVALDDKPDARAILAQALRAAGRMDEALDALAQAAAKNPARSDLAAMRALWLLEAARYDDASAAAEALLKAPNPPVLAYWVRARLRLRQDRYRAAVDDLHLVAAAERQSPFCAAAAVELLKQLGAE